MNRFFETARLLKVVMGFALVAWALESPAAGAVAPPCGDGVCSSSEINTCPADCLVVAYDCPQDCGSCGVCGNAICDPLETCSTCAMDCGVCGCDRDGRCEPDRNETCSNCSL